MLAYCTVQTSSKIFLDLKGLSWYSGDASQYCFVCCAQDFAEKPKGDALEAMKVDTTVLGEQADFSSPSLDDWVQWRSLQRRSCSLVIAAR